MGGNSRWLGSSVGRKALMAASGLLLCLFLLVHLLGNLSLLIADDGSLTWRPGPEQAGQHFTGVVSTYTAIPAILTLVELCLLALFGLHMILGVSLWLKNRAARGQSYVVHKSEGARSLGSATMPITGLFMIAVFLGIHLINFRFGPTQGPEDMVALVDAIFSGWHWVLIYLIALAGLMVHLSHGVQSAFQSLGLSRGKWTSRLKLAGWAYALLMLGGFGILPVLFFLKGLSA